MPQHKLYTEKQVVDIILDSFISEYPTNANDILLNYTPISLPNDEEIIKIASQETNNINEQIAFNNGAMYVCKLIEEQIPNK